MNACYLQKHVHLGLPSDSGVLLDLRNGDYIGLSPAQVTALSRVVRGWPRSTQSHPVRTSEEVIHLIGALVARGLLTEDETLGNEKIQILRSL